MTRFNPDPKLQAEAMIDQHLIMLVKHYRPPATDHILPYEVQAKAAKDIAISTAEACKANSTAFGDDLSREEGQRFSISERIETYWQAVILHLEEYNP